MGRLLLILGIFIIMPLCGCFEKIISQSKADVVLIDYPSETGWDIDLGYYLKVTFKVKNVGEEPAKNVRIKLYVEDQNKEKEFDNSFLVTAYLEPGDMAERTITIDYEGNDTLLKAHVTVMWDGGENKYYIDWTV